VKRWEKGQTGGDQGLSHVICTALVAAGNIYQTKSTTSGVGGENKETTGVKDETNVVEQGALKRRMEGSGGGG